MNIYIKEKDIKMLRDILANDVDLFEDDKEYLEKENLIDEILTKLRGKK
jgi:hypothetical protein